MTLDFLIQMIKKQIWKCLNFKISIRYKESSQAPVLYGRTNLQLSVERAAKLDFEIVLAVLAIHGRTCQQ